MAKIRKQILSALSVIILMAYLIVLSICGLFTKLCSFLYRIVNKMPWQVFMLIFLGLFVYCAFSLNRSLIFIIPMILAGLGFLYSIVKWIESRRV